MSTPASKFFVCAASVKFAEETNACCSSTTMHLACRLARFEGSTSRDLGS
jgi:hypothetical protein